MKGWSELSDEELHVALDDHLLMALRAAGALHHGERQLAEDLVRDRLVALSDSLPTQDALVAEETRRRMDRLMSAIRLDPTAPEGEGDD